MIPKSKLTIPFIIYLIFIPISWFSNHPIQLPAASQYAIKQLEKAFPEYKGSIKEAIFHWDKSLDKPVIAFYEVNLSNKDKSILHINKTTTSFDLLGLLSVPKKAPIELGMFGLEANIKGFQNTMDNAPSVDNYSLKSFYNFLNKVPFSKIIVNNASFENEKQKLFIDNLDITPGIKTKIKLETPYIQDFELQLNFINIYNIRFAGSLFNSKFTGSVSNKNNVFNFKLQSGPLSVKNLLKAWPKFVKPTLYSWLAKNLTGHIKSSNSSIKVAYNHDSFSIENMESIINLSQAKIFYMDGAPAVYLSNPSIYIKNNDLEIKTSKAKINNIPITIKKAIIEDLGNRSNLILNADCATTLKKTLALALLHTKNAKPNFNILAGEANSSIDLNIELGTNKPAFIQVKSDLTKVSAKNIYEGHDINNGKLLANYTNGLLKISGEAIIDNKIPVHILFQEENKDTSTDLQIILTDEILEKLGLPKITLLKKPLTVDYLNITKGGNSQNTISIKLEDNLFHKNNPIFSILKLGPISGTLNLEFTENNVISTTPRNYSLNMPKLNSTGTIQLTKDFSLKSIASKKTKWGNTEFSFQYNSNEDINKLSIEGKSFSLENINIAKLISGGEKSTKPFLLNTNLEKLIMYNGISLKSPDLHLDCSPTLCTNAVLKGKIDDTSNLSLSFKYPNFSLYSNNAGKSLKALNIYNNMKGGLLSITANVGEKSNVTRGYVDIAKYHLTHTPVLSKLLSITAASSISFGGVEDLLTGSGMGFARLKCPLTYSDKKLNLEDCVQSGNVLKMTASGSINIVTGDSNINGILAPVNFINTITGSIPIIKNLAGGSKGGLIAVTYTMNGNIYKNPKINVNPLSILAPGFLKDLGRSN